MKKIIYAFVIGICLISCNNKKSDPMDDMLYNAYGQVYADMTLNDYSRENLQALKVLIENDSAYTEFYELIQQMIDAGTFDFHEGKDCPVDIKVSASGPSSVNGWDVSIKATNNSKKTIKYIVFTVVGYNSVNDPVVDEFGKRCRYTGPLNPGKTDKSGKWTLYMESKMQRGKFEARNVEITYMDGTTWPVERSSDAVRKEYEDLFSKCHGKKLH